MNANTFSTNWPGVKAKLKRKYAQLADSDLEFIAGREQEMVARIQVKTGATRTDLERYLDGRETSPVTQASFI